MNTQPINEVSMNVDPGILLADDNSRFNLKKDRIESLLEDIKVHGMIQPIEVMELESPVNGCLYRVTSGHYRTEVGLKLKEENPSYTVPVVVRPAADGADRLKRQLAENVERENLSPMDMAVAAQRLLDAGVPKLDIRAIFKRPGGKKGNKVQPCSNAYLNILLSFLEFPKGIQNKIHSGELPFSSAYKLSRYPKEKWDAIVADAEAAREKELEQEAKEEEKFLKSEQKAAEADTKLKAVTTELEAAQAKAAGLTEAAKASAAKAKEAYDSLKAVPAKDKEKKTEAEKAFKEAEEKNKEADKAAVEAQAALEKLQGKAKTAAEHAEERRKKLEAARQLQAKKGPSPAQIDKAAAGQGATPRESKEGTAGHKGVKPTPGVVPLNATQMREMVHNLGLPGSYPKVSVIGQILERCFGSLITPGQAYEELAYSVTKEKKEKPKHLAAAPQK